MAPVNQRNRPNGMHKEQKTGLLIFNALTKMKQKTGFTANAITKFIQSEYGGVDGEKVSQALRRGVNLGLFDVHAQKYRLNSRAEKSFGEQTDKGRRRSRRKKSRRSKSRSGSRKRRRRSGGRRRRRR